MILTRCHSKSCVKRNFPKREQRGDNTGISCPFHQNLQFHYGGNYACLQEKAYHIADSPFKVGAIFPTAARAARISLASACPGSKRRADGLGTGDARGARCLHWSRLGRM